MRTGLAIGALFPSFLMGLPAAAGNNWRRAVNIASSTWGELGTALAGLEVHVRGEGERLGAPTSRGVHLQPPVRDRHGA